MSQRARVAHLTSVHPPFDRRICVQCEALAAAGWPVSLIAQEGPFAVPDVTHVPLPPAPSRLSRLFVSSWQVFRRALNSGARICHFHDPELLPVGMLLRLFGRKVIYDVHEDMPLQILNKTWLPKWARWPISRATGAVEWLATRVFFSAVVAATPPIARRFQPRDTVTVQNFPKIEPAAEGPALAERADCAVYIGVIEPNRGAAEMVRAIGLSRRPETRLILGGKFSGETVEEECRALAGWARTDFRGWMDREQVSSALAEAKVGLVTLAPIPNYLESYPTKLFEYMAAGVPVVASDFPLWRQIVERAGCGLLVDPQNPEAIAEAIDWLLDHPDEAAQMGAAGKVAARDTYNWQSEAEKLVALYERLDG